ncbi:thioredoxin [Myxococcota bacterium]|nr:thioredoxin [Myxococcota bacterium]MBU1243305.1 thioredoxin [Myxococcota bacterium]MBU1412828.1 thioredoxin [Myxococcota bacterium]MBU1510121.1 thioredoxin [Myxococcota bacterium]PKN27347.1 MAG: thioredoxin [Deltaproteobacteria bacterium HGW-Deltaproteobacteria-22]
MAIQVTDKTFDAEVLQSPLPVLVDFWAPWCGPCRMVGPVMEELSKETEGRVKVVKLDVQENPGVANRYGIRSIPTVTLFHKGAPAGTLVGARSKADYLKLVEKAF